jgi:hypothetical protein
MTILSDLISVDAIDANLSAMNKKALFQQLASAAARVTGLPAASVSARPALAAESGSRTARSKDCRAWSASSRG